MHARPTRGAVALSRKEFRENLNWKKTMVNANKHSPWGGGGALVWKRCVRLINVESRERTEFTLWITLGFTAPVKTNQPCVCCMQTFTQPQSNIINIIIVFHQ